jgi:pimeloyl-ACP methyl ester carboxylesterase
LLSWAAHGPLGPLVSTALARPSEKSPSEVADYFDGLPPDEARLLVLSDPLRFGNLEGVPIDLRDEANRITAEQERRRLQAELDSLMVEVRKVGSGTGFDVGKRFLTGKIDVGFRFWEPNDESVVRANEIVARIGTLDQVLGGDDLKILAFDPAGDGKVVVAIGDVGRADDIALIVPGMGTDLGNFDGTLGNARRLHDEMWKVGNPGDYATIAWLDYDAPDSLPDATSGHKATSQAYRLRDTIADLRISNHDAHITVISHSYGGRLTGEAAKMGLEVDDLVFVGGPGTGNNRASDLRLNEGGGVWAGRAADDKIAAAELVDTHGPDPTGADFGAELIMTDGASGHSEYFDEGTESLTNLAKISRRIPPETQAVDSGADAIDRGIWSVKRVLRTPTRLTPITL